LSGSNGVFCAEDALFHGDAVKVGEGWVKRAPSAAALARFAAAGSSGFPSLFLFIVLCAPAGRNYLQRKDRNFKSSAAVYEAWVPGSEEAFGVKMDTLMRMRLWKQNRDSRRPYGAARTMVGSVPRISSEAIFTSSLPGGFWGSWFPALR
jgi:hypothetical protein